MYFQDSFGESQSRTCPFPVWLELVEQTKYLFVVCRFYAIAVIPNKKHRSLILVAYADLNRRRQ